jgi:hypothetical protein
MSKADAKPDETITKDEENPIDPIKDEKGGPPSEAEPQTSNLDTIADNLSTSMPDVQQHAIDQENSDEADRLAQYSDLRDASGNSFDPTIHKTNKSGEPTTSTLGKLIKKSGRKPKDPNQKSTVGGRPSGATQPSPKEVQSAQSRASGVMTANLILQIGIVAGGQEWYPVKDENSGLDEKSMLENAFADYFEATGKTDLPPATALLVAVGAYALPRFTMPKTKTRVQKLTGGIKAWFVNRKLKKHGLKAKPTGEREPDEKKSANLSTMAA